MAHLDTNKMKHEMLNRLECTADLAGRQVTVLAALDSVGESCDTDLHDQLTTLHEAVLALRSCVQRSAKIVPWSMTMESFDRACEEADDVAEELDND